MSSIDFAIESMASDLVMLLIEDKHFSLEEALDVLYNSTLYQKLKDPDTGLYYQSPGYVYSYLKNEIDTGKMA
ncbi:MAG: hypothetical protein PHD11_07410 [Bacteroidales bacterium]|nr:hypothetical protein [Bacteroidales bacterium]MDD4670891.1 hypothetical protein [Bacteroidales bacterium]